MKKKVLWQIMMPCLIAVLMLVLMLPVYFLSYNNARQMTVDRVGSRIENGLDRISNMITQHNANLYELARTKEVCNFLKKDATAQQQGINAWRYLMDTKYTHILNDLVKDVMITVRDSDIIIGMGMVSLAPERDYGNHFYVKGMDYTDFRQMLLRTENYLSVMHYFSFYLCNEPCLVYQWRSYSTSPALSISSFLSMEKIKQELGYYDIENAYMRLSSVQTGETLYRSSADETAEDSPWHTMVELEEKHLDLKVEFAIPSDYINRQVQPILYTMIIYALLAFGTAMMASLLHTVRSFRQATPLLAYLGEASMAKGGGSVYEHLYRALQDSDKQSEEIRMQYAELVQERKSLAMDKVAHRLPLEEDSWQALSEIGVLSQRWFAVQFELKRPQEAGQHTVALGVIVKAVLQDAWPSGYIHVSDTSRILCLLPEAESDPMRLDRAARSIEQQTEAVVYVGVSLPHSGVSELPMACDEAQRAAFGAHRGQVAAYSVDMRRPNELSLFGMCRELSERMAAGNEECVNELFSRLREHMGKEPGWQPSQVMHTIASTVEYALANTDDALAQKIQITNRPWRDVFEELNGMALQYCWRIQKRKNQQKSEKAEEIIHYINEHYAEPDICLAQIADHFNVTESYISWYIKAHTGRNYTAHIEELRMQEAMRLLKCDACSIQEIAQRVGFERINTFYKSFRRYWGNAPGTYRTKG